MGTLYVVATPIGNLEDITLRALRILAEADVVLAEDTRRTRILLDRHGVAANPRSLHAHNEAARSEEILRALAAGSAVALVTDAGTPLISDPGDRLVARATRAGHRVESIPGASAVLSALVVAGLPAAPFSFLGFLPRKSRERAKLLAEHAQRRETLVLFESPKRVAKTLAELAAVFGADRPACLARELTKLHEEVLRGSLGELVEAVPGELRGEITLVIAGAPPPEVDLASLRPRVREALAGGQGARDIARALHEETGISRRELYAIVLEEKGR